MKPRSILLSTLFLFSAASSQAQGTVQFQNGQITFATPADRFVYFGAVGGTKLTGTNNAAGLWYVPGADRRDVLCSAGGTQAGALAFFRPATTATPGVWNNGTAGNTRILDGVAIGSYATLQVRVWDITKYGTFAQAFAAGEYTWSVPFNFRAPDFAHGDPATAAYMEGLRAFGGAPGLCPEPSALALGLLAGGACWFMRRRAGNDSRSTTAP
jgi:hypothetical protein